MGAARYLVAGLLDLGLSGAYVLQRLKIAAKRVISVLSWLSKMVIVLLPDEAKKLPCSF